MPSSSNSAAAEDASQWEDSSDDVLFLAEDSSDEEENYALDWRKMPQHELRPEEHQYSPLGNIDRVLADRVFDNFDADGNGKLELDEFFKCVQAVDSGADLESVKSTFSKISPRNPTFLDRQCFHQWIFMMFEYCGTHEIEQHL